MAKDSLVARVSFSSEDSSTLCAGDLGLGFGLKPGGLPKSDLTSAEFYEPLSLLADLQSPFTEQLESPEVAEDYEGKNKNSNWGNSLEERVEQFQEKTGSSRISSFMISLPKRSFSFTSRNRKTTEIATHNSGTSRKERSRGLRRINSVRERSLVDDSDYQSLQRKLLKAKQEIETLTVDLEACQQQLQSKYGAVKIIQKLSCLEQARQKQHSRKALEASKRLEKEVNLLQWELELKQSYLLDSEQTWAERFDRVATENAALMVALQSRGDELRKITIEKMSMMRERDELAAALEVRDRIKYDLSSPDREGIMSTGDLIIELATLGACQCRGKNQEPCACARAAVDAKREVAKLNNELELVYRREEEALLTADAYRVAFEQQLAKNSTLICDLLEKSNRRKKFGCPNPVKKRTQSQNGVKAREDPLHEMQIHKDEIVEELLSMLNDNSEALVHQRLATKMLAAKMREMEKDHSEQSPRKK